MNTLPQRQFFELFEEAVAISLHQQSAFLDQACGSDLVLRRRLQAMLVADAKAQANGFLNKLQPHWTVSLQSAGDTAALRSPDPAAVPLQTSALGPYLLQDLLGRGGMGQVYKARHQQTGTMAAVKTILVPHQDLVEGLRREVRALARLRHPSIVRILDEGLHEGLPWYAMELLEGTPLSQYWPIGTRPPLESVLQFVYDLGSPLSYLHGEGLVHRDLKPANILVRGETPVLIDFGLLASFSSEIYRDALELEVVGAGTPAYMAPEQIRGETCDARADLYALGCIFFELLTGRRIFETRNHAEMLAAHLFQPPPTPSHQVAGLPEDLDRLVLRLLAKDPRQRLGHADDLAEALRRLGAKPRDQTTPPARPYLYRPGFAGRGPELERLRRSLQDPSGQIAFVGGQSGLGKTRLALELAREATRSKLWVLTGETLPPQHGYSGPLQPFRAPLQRMADRCREHGRAETQRLFGPHLKLLSPYAPTLSTLPGFEDAPDPPQLPAKEAHLRLFQALAEVLQAAAHQQPLLLILDDLQWADELTLGFLASLLRTAAHPEWGLNPGHWLLLGLYRTEEASDALRALVGCAPALHLQLGRLEPAAVGSMIAEMLALPQPPPLFSRFVDRHSEGNPFFIAEYLRTAISEGLLGRDQHGTWQIAEPGRAARAQDYEALPLPRSLRELVQRRLGGLPQAALHLAQLTSVVGREAETALLRRVAPLEEAELDAALQELLRRQVLEEPQPGSLRFVHDKLHEGAYDRIEPQRRPSLHRSVAEALEALPTADAVQAERAHHWERADEPQRASPCYLAAAQAAQKDYAHDRAKQLFQGYLRLLSGPTVESTRIRLKMVWDLMLEQGRHGEAMSQLELAGDEAARLGSEVLLGERLRILGHIHVRKGPPEKARALLDQALLLARKTQDGNLEALTLKTQGMLLRNEGRIAEALDVLHQALTLHQRLDDEPGQCGVLISLGNMHQAQGQHDLSRQLGLQALALARKLANQHSEAVILGNMAINSEENETEAQKIQHHEDAIALHRQVGNWRGESIVKLNLSLLYRDMAQLDRASQLCKEALLGSRQTESSDVTAVILSYLSEIELTRTGDPGLAQVLVQEGLELVERQGQALGLGKLICQQGTIAVAQGKPRRDLLQRADSLASNLQVLPESELGRMVAHLRNATEAFELGQHHLLFRGRRIQDYPVALQGWIRQQDPIPA